jgi:hypothetical protein
MSGGETALLILAAFCLGFLLGAAAVIAAHPSYWR